MNVQIKRKNFLILLFIILTKIVFVTLIYNLFKTSGGSVIKLNDLDQYLNQPVIFIGGSMSSGTSLMRSILDVHPKVNCGPETKITHLALRFLYDLFEKDKSSLTFMKNAGISNETVKKSFGMLIYYVMLSNVRSKQVERICDKEPSNREYIVYYKSVFPYSKFIYVIRDGRDASYSLLKRVTSKRGFAAFLSILRKWNSDNRRAYKQCVEVGQDYCLIVRYEKLVSSPETEMRKISEFLNLSWTERFLNHEKYIHSEIVLSKTEWSRKGLEQKINNGSVGSWEGNIVKYDSNVVSKEIDMLHELGYM